uniref:PRC-barrel domain-containing protein n=1 Tax=Pararhizobium sp. IMCC3301 TaxID=3067904 RepID=UPI0027420807|nr:PRC-barrel domain-containing protein [Pararhizobium sp. IMCC3301]
MSDINIAASNIPASKVRGTKVYNLQDEHLGEIDDIVLSKYSGEAQFAIMSFGGFLGIGEEYHPVPWKSLKYDIDKGGYRVDIDRERLEDAPRYGVNREPDWNDTAYGGRLTDYWGIPPVGYI